MLISIGLLLLIAALITWRYGKRGRRIDNHRLCANCHYDLTGLPQISSRCPECGRNIKARRGTRIGNRKPLQPLACFGLLGTLAGLTLLAFGLHHWWQNFDSMPWRPEFLLRQNVTAPGPRIMFYHPAIPRPDPLPFRERALDEVHRRLNANTYSKEGIRALADDILTLQADPHTDWDCGWGDVIVRAALSHQLTAAQRERFLRQMALPELKHLTVAPRGGWAIYEGTLENYKGWRQNSPIVTSADGDLSATLGHVTATWHVRFDLLTGGLTLVEKVPELALEPGRYNLTLEGPVTIHGDWKELGDAIVPFRKQFEIEIIDEATPAKTN